MYCIHCHCKVEEIIKSDECGATDGTDYNKGLEENLICHYQHMRTTMVSIGSCIPEKHYKMKRSLNIAVQELEIIE